MSEEPGAYTTRENDEPPGAPVLLGCMTGASQEVALKISYAALSQRAKDFLLQVLVASFGTAGYQRRAGSSEPGLTCPFYLAEWAERHVWDRHYLWRIRKQIVDLGILSYEVDAHDPSRGWLKWNLDFTGWRALDPTFRKARYTRPGAGRKSQSNVIRLPAVPDALESNVIQPVASVESNVIQPTASDVIKRDTLASFEAAPPEGWEDPVRIHTEKKIQKKKTDANASVRALPFDADALPAADTDTLPDGLPIATASKKPPVKSDVAIGKGADTPPAPRPRNPIWDTLVEVMGFEPAKGTESSKWGKVVRGLKANNATPDEIRLRAARYRRWWPHLTFTVTALDAHWGELSKESPGQEVNHHGSVSGPAASNGSRAPSRPRPIPGIIIPDPSDNGDYPVKVIRYTGSGQLG